MASYYAIIILYPLLSTFYVKWSLRGGWIATLKNEFYLWGGYSLIFGALLIISITGSKSLTPSMAFPVFIIYTIGYAVLSIIRKTSFSGSYDLKARLSGQ